MWRETHSQNYIFTVTITLTKRMVGEDVFGTRMILLNIRHILSNIFNDEKPVYCTYRNNNGKYRCCQQPTKEEARPKAKNTRKTNSIRVTVLQACANILDTISYLQRQIFKKNLGALFSEVSCAIEKSAHLLRNDPCNWVRLRSGGRLLKSENIFAK